MVVAFEKEYLRDLYETGKSDKKHRFQPDIVKSRRAVFIAIAALRSFERRQGRHFVNPSK